MLPLSLTRTWRQGDHRSRAFGRSGTHPYQMYLWTGPGTEEIDLILPDFGQVRFFRTSGTPGTKSGTWQHTSSPSGWYLAQLAYDSAHDTWNVTRRDGTIYVFPQGKPLSAIRDRWGNLISITRLGESRPIRSAVFARRTAAGSRSTTSSTARVT